MKLKREKRMINLLSRYKRQVIESFIKDLYKNNYITRRQGLKMWYRVNKKRLNECGICHCILKGERNLDHIIPKSKGGTGDFKNLQFTHYKCNFKKGNNNDL